MSKRYKYYYYTNCEEYCTPDITTKDIKVEFFYIPRSKKYKSVLIIFI